ncbi:hypothetical protein [Paenibacillus sp. YN15]|uniref:hypothetical protein n=1 Tax=Paenibacillus sp. YN15 TaxID=1742774 RepID=UPI000DCF2AB4|nr:hypothetical protein [Paenibacillus sp. YN15]RAU91696.1 hypothetical protein DQG13_28810 [Paenibacillus sp. YN15]
MKTSRSFLIGQYGGFDAAKQIRDFRRGFYGVEACLLQTEEDRQKQAAEAKRQGFRTGIPGLSCAWIQAGCHEAAANTKKPGASPLAAAVGDGVGQLADMMFPSFSGSLPVPPPSFYKYRTRTSWNTSAS